MEKELELKWCEFCESVIRDETSAEKIEDTELWAHKECALNPPPSY